MYTPDPDYCGTDVIGLMVGDGLKSAKRSLRIDVAAVDDAPTLAFASSNATAMRPSPTGALLLPAMLVDDVDEVCAPQPGLYTLRATASQGSITIGGPFPGVSAVAGEAAVVTGTLGRLNDALLAGLFQYIPAAGSEAGDVAVTVTDAAGLSASLLIAGGGVGGSGYGVSLRATAMASVYESSSTALAGHPFNLSLQLRPDAADLPPTVYAELQVSAVQGFVRVRDRDGHVITGTSPDSRPFTIRSSPEAMTPQVGTGLSMVPILHHMPLRSYHG